MKIVHTADWHIGKTLKGKQRGEEYREILSELKDFLSENQVDILIIAGDVFDSFTPSAQAEDIVYNFLHDVSRMKISSVVIAGNHDSSLRFEAISKLMSLAGVTMVGFLPQEQQDKYSDIITGNSTVARIVPFPFVSESYFVRADDLSRREGHHIHYSQSIGKRLKEIAENFTPDKVNIIVGHMLMHGAKPGGSERRLYLGDNYAVLPEEIPANVDYVALGHIHRRQRIDAPAPVYYCGSPLQMDFGEKETDKGFLFLEIEPGQIANPKFVPFNSGKKLLELKGSPEEINKIIEENQELTNSHLKITLTDTGKNLDASYRLKRELPNVVEIRRLPIQTQSQENLLEKGVDWLPQLYRHYCKENHAQSEVEEAMTQFQQLYRQCLVQDVEE